MSAPSTGPRVSTGAHAPSWAQPPHALDAGEVLARLDTDAQRGLSLEQVGPARERSGPNELQRPARVTRLQRLARQFRSLVVWVLIGAALISLFLGEHVDALTILAIVALDAGLGFFQEQRAARALEALERYAAPTARVLRAGRAIVVPARELVPGDLIEVEAGDAVPADARLVQGSSLRTQEAALTGESQAVRKRADTALPQATPLAERENMLHMGTVVAAGRGRGVVTATGMDSELGRIAGLLERTASPPTPLQRRLAGLGRLLVALCLGLVALIAGLQLARGGELVEVLMLAVSLAVAAIPEGLPAVVTVALALGLQRLVRRNALVRHLPSVETLGSVTVICTDKTGTLTRNEMTVRRIESAGRDLRVSGRGYAPQGDFLLAEGGGERALDPRADPDLGSALRTAAICNHAEVQPGAEPGQPWQVVGDPTEGALRTLALKGGVEEPLEHGEVLDLELPFDAERRRMSVVVRSVSGRRTAHVKGAPEVLLPRCKRELRGGVEQPLAEERRQAVLQAAASMAGSALRVLALARREDAPDDAERIEQELTLLALVGMQDPPRQGAREAVATCRAAGVRPVMVTGDHPVTAGAIAAELEIGAPGEPAVAGPELDDLDDDALRQRVGRSSVFARVSAEHKLRIVRALQAQDQIVAMTGDGVNDAPALQEADIGVAMGRTGTDVTRGAADMVLLDDDFGTIVAAVEEGRCIFDDITKFVHYLLATNAAEVLAVLAAVVGGWPVPLLPVQILWINLVTDGLPALALGLEPPESDLMRRPPRPPRSPVVRAADGAWLLACGVLVALVTTCALAWSLGTGATLERARSLAFSVLVAAQLAVAFSFRSRTRTALGLGLLSNGKLVAAAVVALALQAIVLAWAPLREIFGTVLPGPRELGVAALLALLPVTVLELAKLLLARRRSG